jgi:AraC-like DNA-binding protein
MIKPLQDGLKCVYYLENKMEEIMLLMRVYYTRELLAEFFASLSHDYLVFKTSISENRNMMLSVKDLAEMNHSSISGFHHRFKKIMGTTPSRWKNEERVKMIFRELMTSDKPLKQISDEQGFQSISYFNKFCKKHLGKPPGQIRKEK